MHNELFFHDGPKVPKSATDNIVLWILKLINFKAFLRYNTTFASLINFYFKLLIIEIYRLSKQARKWWLEFFRQGLNRESLVCSINCFYTFLTENIAVRLRLFLICIF